MQAEPDEIDEAATIEAAAIRTFSVGDNETSERLNRRLLEISPNWVLAYNQLGYITMLQGRFAEAEEYFTSYRFIAPDQATFDEPCHDLRDRSSGQLGTSGNLHPADFTVVIDGIEHQSAVM